MLCGQYCGGQGGGCSGGDVGIRRLGRRHGESTLRLFAVGDMFSAFV